MERKIDSLTFVPLRIPRLIPRELIEAVKGCTFTPEQFYSYNEEYAGPKNHLYVMVDPDKKIHGFLWAETNALDGSLFVNTFSISKEFWGKGEAVEKAKDFLRGLVEKLKSPRVFWCTTNERFFVKHGFKRSKISLMEYNLN